MPLCDVEVPVECASGLLRAPDTEHYFVASRNPASLVTSWSNWCVYSRKCPVSVLDATTSLVVLSLGALSRRRATA